MLSVRVFECYISIESQLCMWKQCRYIWSDSTVRSVTVQRETISGLVANPINIMVTPAVVVSSILILYSLFCKFVYHGVSENALAANQLDSCNLVFTYSVYMWVNVPSTIHLISTLSR